MKALVFGAGGQLGRSLGRTLPPEVELVAVDRRACDITDGDAVERAVAAAKPDLVFNAAAYTAVDRAESERDAANMLNAVAPGVVAAASRRHGARTVYVSTDFVFDGCASRPYRPGDEVGPLSVYGQTKLDGERAVAVADPEALIVRTAWVYASHGANFVATMLRLMAERDRVTIVADQVGTPTSALSLAGALWELARSGASGIYHHTDAGVASWYDFAVAIGEEALAAGLLAKPAHVIPIATEDYPTAARRPAFSVLDKSATWTRIGHVSPHWRDNLRAVIQDIATRG